MFVLDDNNLLLRSIYLFYGGPMGIILDLLECGFLVGMQFLKQVLIPTRRCQDIYICILVDSL